MDAFNDSLILTKIDILLTFNNPHNPLLIHEGAGIIPKQVEWILDELGWHKTLPNIVYVTGMLIFATTSAGFAYTLVNEEPDEEV